MINITSKDIAYKEIYKKAEQLQEGWYTIIKPIEELPMYTVGKLIPLHIDRFGQLVWHVYNQIVVVPTDAVKFYKEFTDK